MQNLEPAVASARPPLDEASAASLAGDLWGRRATASELPSERDRVFLVEAAGGELAILKVANRLEPRRSLEARTALLEHLSRANVAIQTPVPIAGEAGGLATVSLHGDDYVARLLSHVPGEAWTGITPLTPALERGLGDVVASVDEALSTLECGEDDLPPVVWDPRGAAAMIGARFDSHTDAARRELVERTLSSVSQTLDPLADSLPVSLIHNDAHGDNVRVDPGSTMSPARIVGLVDFGDALRTWSIAGLATAAAYAGMGRRDPIETFANLTRGYAAVRQPSEAEADALYELIRLRLALSVTISAVRGAHEPENPYLTTSAAGAWTLLERLSELSPDLARYRLRAAAGLDPVPGAARVAAALDRAAGDAAPIIAPDPRGGGTLIIDLSVESGDDGGTFDQTDHTRFNRLVFDRMRDAGAAVGIGRYDEVRWWYTTDEFIAPGNEVDEWRTVHLGIDLFAEPDTPIMTPLPGRIVSVHDNADRLDYGPTVILEHEIADDYGQAGDDAGPTRFRTLYGHLSPRTLDEIEPGREVAAGETIGWVGAPPRNGDWAPHLHFQILVDPLDYEGTFPGVAAPSQRDVWLALSPDPDRLLGLAGETTAPRPRPQSDLVAERGDRLGPSLSLSYDRPLHIVRGRGSRLYDVDGQPFLDCVNNVAHVGHSHPRITDAARRQLGILNTNTRYLHETILEYTRELTARLPDPLSVCFLVCSGTEATELALRMARTHTKKTGAVVVEGAYHGNSSSVINLSPYKFDGPGGKGVRPWVRVVPMPDVYRGRYRADGTDSEEIGPRYAEHVAEALASLNGDDGMYGSAKPLGAAAFFCESLLSCGGQIPLPPGYLRAAAKHVRDAGAVYVADEVQVGFGRVGPSFWGFAEHGVVPDIVTLGKPIGNGHPLSVVVTTPEIARSFDNGMEYFNTFGGNPVSAAIGLEVLGIIDDEGLAEHAAAVGDHLLDGLRDLSTRHEAVGDVRGRGLFVGIELVSDPTARTPAPELARKAVERMRERGILLSTDGPDHNVIKIKPPLVFSRPDADRVIAGLDAVLAESWARIG